MPERAAIAPTAGIGGPVVVERMASGLGIPVGVPTMDPRGVDGVDPAARGRAVSGYPDRPSLHGKLTGRRIVGRIVDHQAHGICAHPLGRIGRQEREKTGRVLDEDIQPEIVMFR